MRRIYTKFEMTKVKEPLRTRQRRWWADGEREGPLPEATMLVSSFAGLGHTSEMHDTRGKPRTRVSSAIRLSSVIFPYSLGYTVLLVGIFEPLMNESGRFFSKQHSQVVAPLRLQL